MQIILCYESRPAADTDFIYIKSFLDFEYPAAKRKFKLTKISLETKTKYNSKKIKASIKTNTNNYAHMHPNEKTYVVYCLDVDNSLKDEINNADVINYCEENNYELVWFNKDVEDVFLGKQISDSKKTKEAANFAKQNKIQQLNIKLLNCHNPLTKHHYSNLKIVFDKYLKIL